MGRMSDLHIYLQDNSGKVKTEAEITAEIGKAGFDYLNSVSKLKKQDDGKGYVITAISVQSIETTYAIKWVPFYYDRWEKNIWVPAKFSRKDKMVLGQTDYYAIKGYLEYYGKKYHLQFEELSLDDVKGKPLVVVSKPLEQKELVPRNRPIEEPVAHIRSSEGCMKLHVKASLGPDEERVIAVARMILNHLELFGAEITLYQKLPWYAGANVTYADLKFKLEGRTVEIDEMQKPKLQALTGDKIEWSPTGNLHEVKIFPEYDRYVSRSFIP